MFVFEGQEVKFKDDFTTFERMDDVIESLRALTLSVERASENKLAWKYAVISVHSALQGIVCASLRQGNSFAMWKPKDFKKWMEAYEKGDEQRPIPNLDYFMKLFDKLFSEAKEINRSDIVWLNSVRNELTHFNSGSFSICLHSTFICCWEALKAIELAPKIKELNYIGSDELARFNIHLDKSKNVMRQYLKNNAVKTANGEENGTSN